MINSNEEYRKVGVPLLVLFGTSQVQNLEAMG